MGVLICPDCGENNREDALCCSMCQRLFRKERDAVGGPIPPQRPQGMAPIEHAFQELSNAVIDAVPETWRVAQVAVFFLPEGMDCQVLNPEDPSAQLEPTPRMTDAIQHVGDTKLRWGHHWRSLLFAMERRPDGQWLCTTTPNFDG